MIDLEINWSAFCDNEEGTRYTMSTPWETADAIVATDSRIMIVVPKESYLAPSIARHSKTDETKRYPNPSSVFAYAKWGEMTPYQFDGSCGKCSKGVSRQPCEECKGKRKVECDNCDGDGIAECDMGHDHDCDECDGRGKYDCENCDEEGMTEQQCQACQPDRRWSDVSSLATKYATAISQLPDIKACMCLSGQPMLLFRFADCCYGAVMLMRNDD